MSTQQQQYRQRITFTYVGFMIAGLVLFVLALAHPELDWFYYLMLALGSGFVGISLGVALVAWGTWRSR